MGKKVFYKKRKSLPGWSQFYITWLVLFILVFLLVLWLGTDSKKKIHSIQQFSLKENPLHKKRKKISEIRKHRWIQSLNRNSIEVHFKSSIQEKIKLLHSSNIETSSCSYTSLGKLRSYRSTIIFDVKQASSSLIKQVIKIFVQENLFIHSNTRILLIYKNTNCNFFDNNVGENHLLIRVASHRQLASPLYYYGGNLTLPNVALSNILKVLAPYNFFDHLFAGLENEAMFGYNRSLMSGISAFMINLTPKANKVFSNKTIINLLASSVKIGNSEESLAANRLWLSSARALTTGGYRVLLFMLLVLCSLPFLCRVSSNQKFQLVEPILSSLYFTIIIALALFSFKILSLSHLSLNIYLIISSIIFILTLFIGKYFERKVLAVKFNTTSALIPIFLCQFILFLSNSSAFLILIPGLFLLAQVKDSQKPKSIFLQFIFLLYVFMSFIFPMMRTVSSKVDSFQLLAFLDHAFIYFVFLAFTLGSYISLISKNTKTKGYF